MPSLRTHHAALYRRGFAEAISAGRRIRPCSRDELRIKRRDVLIDAHPVLPKIADQLLYTSAKRRLSLRQERIDRQFELALSLGKHEAALHPSCIRGFDSLRPQQRSLPRSEGYRAETR
jgi:hypothetical protein